MNIKSIALGIFCCGWGLAAWAVTEQLPTTNKGDVSTNKSCTCTSPNDDLTKANQSDISVLVWANEAAVTAFTYNFVNYEKDLQTASQFFTPDGWKQFEIALKKSNNLEAVKAKKLIVSAVATRAPIVLQKGLLDGVYSWRVQMPIMVTYQSANEFTQQDNIVTMLIVREPSVNAPRGIGISQFIVGPAKSEP